MKKLGLLMLLMVSVSAYGQGFYDGFEDGTMNNWTVIPRTNGVNLSVQTMGDNNTVLPHSGTYLAYQARYYGTYPGVRHSLSAVSKGTVTFWVNPMTFDGTYLFNVCVYGGHGETLRFMNGDTGGKKIRIIKPGNVNYYPGIDITGRTWHEVKFVIKDNTTPGSQVYYDGSLIADNITGIFDLYTLEMGTNWGSASVAYDDVSFVPEGLTVVNATGQLNLEGFTGDLRDVRLRAEVRGGTTQVLYPNLDASGNFTLQGLPVLTNYTFAFKTYGHLQKTVTKTINVGDASLGTVTLLSGDANGDNAVNGTDLNLLLAHLDEMGGL